jgi:hypothetical protein
VLAFDEPGFELVMSLSGAEEKHEAHSRVTRRRSG